MNRTSRTVRGSSAIQQRLDAIASPARMEIITTIQNYGPCSIAQLAAHIQRKPVGLYHHVRVLLQAGILKETERRKSARRDLAVFGLTSERIGGEVDPANPMAKESAIRAAEAALRLAGREFADSLHRSLCTLDGPAQNLRLSRQRIWLTPKAVVRLNQMLAGVERFLARQNKLKKGRLHALTTLLSPSISRQRK